MHLAALLIVGNRSDDALISVPDVEHLIRRAREAGATHAVVLSERITSALVASIARLRTEGLSVDLARAMDDVTEMVHPDEHVLLIPSDVVIAPERLAALAAAPVPTLLCLPDSIETATFERVDATSRWSGALLIDGALLRSTAAMVGDWDLASTLMRTAAQNHAGRMTVALDALPTAFLPIGVEVERMQAARILLGRTTLSEDGWASRTLFNALARKLGVLAVDIGIEARWVSLAGLACFAGSVLAALAGWIAMSMVLYLIADVVDRTGDLLTRAAMAAVPWQRWRTAARWGTAAIVGLATGTTLFFRTLQWGCMVLGSVMVGAEVLTRHMKPTPDRWKSDPPALALIGFVGVVAGAPVIALAVMTVVAIADLARTVFRGNA